MPVNTTIKFRQGTEAQWTSTNPILASGEPGYVADANRFKIGDGVSNWNSLSYASVVPSGFLVGSGININLGTNGESATISVSGLINNPANNRILTSRDNTTTGIDAESNLTFDGSLLAISGEFVAKTGTLDTLSFNVGSGVIEQNIDLQIGEMSWNSDEGTIDYGIVYNGSNVSHHIGQETFYRVHNETGSTLYAGMAVYASGVHSAGQRISVSPYIADGSIREVRFVGIITSDILTGNDGYATHFGFVKKLNTQGIISTNYSNAGENWSVGDILYVDPTTPGKLTNIEPKHSISAAIITSVSSNNGRIFVRPTSYGHLNDNHDVSVSGATNGQFLQYNSVTDYWVPSSSGNFTTLLVNGTGVSASGHTHTASSITDFNSAVSGLLPTISNSGDNRILTSTGTSIGINGESNATFDGANFNVSGVINLDNLRLDGNTLSSTNTNGNILFVPNGTGKVGVGTSTPSGLLQVAGSGLFSSVSSGVSPISLLGVYSTVSGANLFSVEGTNGSLFSVIDNLSGSLMSVNNNAGLPVFEVFSDDSIIAGRFNQNDFVVTSSGNIGIGTATTTNKLQVSGNVGVSGLITATSGNYISSLQVNGTNVSVSGHAHTSSDITNFNTAVSGLLHKNISFFTAMNNQPPASAFATLDTRNSIPVLEFDAASNENAIFMGVLPNNASIASGLVVDLWWMADTATSGNVVWSAQFEAQGTDNDSDSFDVAASGTGTANGTNGIETETLITCTSIDSLVAGNRYRLRVTRVANNANDTMVGDAQLIAVEVRAV